MAQTSGLPLDLARRSPPSFSYIETQNSEIPVAGTTPKKSSTSKSPQTTSVEPGRRQRKRCFLRKESLPRSTCLDRGGTPTTTLTLPTILLFVFFLTFLGIAANHAIRPVWISLIIFAILTSSALVLACFHEYRRSDGRYRPELGFTISVIVMAIPTFTGLYANSWYHQLRTNILVSSLDSATQVQFPSIAILQRNDWTSQGNILNGGSKCFLGWYNDSAPACASLDPSTLGNSTQCTCKELWYNNDDVIENFVWMNTSYRFKVFDSPSWFIGNNPTYILLLQTFFNYDMTRAFDDSSTTDPSLMIAVYDPSLGMQAAFELGFTRMNLVNANGNIAVNIGLVRRNTGNGISAYDYSLSLASSPATELVCDTSSPATYKWPCFMSLFIQVPNFDRITITTQKAMSWMDVASRAGGYFSFLQFLGWIISAQAWL